MNSRQKTTKLAKVLIILLFFAAGFYYTYNEQIINLELPLLNKPSENQELKKIDDIQNPTLNNNQVEDKADPQIGQEKVGFYSKLNLKDKTTYLYEVKNNKVFIYTSYRESPEQEEAKETLLYTIKSKEFASKFNTQSIADFYVFDKGLFISLYTKDNKIKPVEYYLVTNNLFGSTFKLLDTLPSNVYVNTMVNDNKIWFVLIIKDSIGLYDYVKINKLDLNSKKYSNVHEIEDILSYNLLEDSAQFVFIKRDKVETDDKSGFGYVLEEKVRLIKLEGDAPIKEADNKNFASSNTKFSTRTNDEGTNLYVIHYPTAAREQYEDILEFNFDLEKIQIYKLENESLVLVNLEQEPLYVIKPDYDTFYVDTNNENLDYYYSYVQYQYNKQNGFAFNLIYENEDRQQISNKTINVSDTSYPELYKRLNYMLNLGYLTTGNLGGGGPYTRNLGTGLIIFESSSNIDFVVDYQEFNEYFYPFTHSQSRPRTFLISNQSYTDQELIMDTGIKKYFISDNPYGRLYIDSYDKNLNEVYLSHGGGDACGGWQNYHRILGNVLESLGSFGIGCVSGKTIIAGNPWDQDYLNQPLYYMTTQRIDNYENALIRYGNNFAGWFFKVLDIRQVDLKSGNDIQVFDFRPYYKEGKQILNNSNYSDINNNDSTLRFLVDNPQTQKIESVITVNFKTGTIVNEETL